MTTYNNLVVLILAGDPVSTSKPQIEAITTAAIEDLGDGNANTTTTHFEENAYGPLVPTTQSVTIDGLIYDASGRVGDDLLNITPDGGGTIYGIKKFLVLRLPMMFRMSNIGTSSLSVTKWSVPMVPFQSRFIQVQRP